MVSGSFAATVALFVFLAACSHRQETEEQERGCYGRLCLHFPGTSFSGNVEEFDAEHGQHALANEQVTVALFPRLVEHGCEQLDIFVNLSAYDFVISFLNSGERGGSALGRVWRSLKALSF